MASTPDSGQFVYCFQYAHYKRRVGSCGTAIQQSKSPESTAAFAEEMAVLVQYLGCWTTSVADLLYLSRCYTVPMEQDVDSVNVLQYPTSAVWRCVDGIEPFRHSFGLVAILLQHQVDHFPAILPYLYVPAIYDSEALLSSRHSSLAL